MEKLPTSLLSLFRSPLTNHLPFFGLAEIFLARKSGKEDESVYSFMTRHFGRKTAETLMDAMISGIYAGNIHNLSVRSCFKVLYDMEQKDRSIVLSVLKSALAGLTSKKTDLAKELRTDECKHLVGATGISFVDGMQTLTDRLTEKINETDEVVVATKITAMEPCPAEESSANAIRLHLQRGDGATDTIDADLVFSTVPIKSLFDTLPPNLSKHICELNESIKHVSVGVINLGYSKESLPYNGFGHLVPSNQWEGILGMIYDSLVFPKQLKGDSGSTLTVMIGGANAPDKARLSEKDMVKFACEKVEEHLGISSKPDVALATPHFYCIPQYPVGHHRRMTDALAHLKTDFPQLEVLGNNFYGVGIADSIANAKRVAKEAAQKAQKS
uniref:Protoporphyrinogen oxidase n=1 Tax=Aplanochytrium stocchinoi TaxID=215587 RepID=A0A7S3PJZ9_9STRA